MKSSIQGRVALLAYMYLRPDLRRDIVFLEHALLDGKSLIDLIEWTFFVIILILIAYIGLSIFYFTKFGSINEANNKTAKTEQKKQNRRK